LNREKYLLQRQKLQASLPQYRCICPQCQQPDFGCYCHFVQKFDPKIKFVILIHPIEVKRRIATGRMSWLCLQNAELIAGQDYSKNKKVLDILEEPESEKFILYPGVRSLNLSELENQRRAEIAKPHKNLTVFVIDGTWATARKTMRLSQNLKDLPRLCFTPPSPSQFRVRKQPSPECYSTLEAIHQTI
jgi:DTW domain-containing protein